MVEPVDFGSVGITPNPTSPDLKIFRSVLCKKLFIIGCPGINKNLVSANFPIFSLPGMVSVCCPQNRLSDELKGKDTENTFLHKLNNKKIVA